MKEIIVPAGGAGKRLDRFVLAELPLLKPPLLQKYLRLGRIKRNGKKAKGDARLCEGDALSLYIGDELFEKPRPRDALLSSFKPHFYIAYEDANLLLADKRPGLIVHPDDKEKVNTLLTHVRAHLYQKGEWDPADKAAFAPVAVNRIDRFTSGLVVFAKTREAMEILTEKFRGREIEKRYLCVAGGKPEPRAGTIDNFLLQPAGQKRVTVLKAEAPGAKRAITAYRTLAVRGDLALLECELITGRTHQIRAQLAKAGRPLLGDAQYGDPALNQKYARGYQALCAYELTFAFEAGAGALEPLRGRRFRASPPPFAREFFPEYKI